MDTTTAVAGLLVVSLLASRPAYAYRTLQDLPELEQEGAVIWPNGTMSYVLHEGGLPGALLADVEQAVWDALEVWTEPACVGVTFEYDGTTPLDAAPDDGLNTVQWLQGGWEEMGFDPDAPAMTDLQVGEREDGIWYILEADIYLNAEHHSWVLRGAPPDGTRDLPSVLAHEAGHALGLLHPCEFDGAEHAPYCYEWDGFAEATMYPAWSPEQSTLSPDDEAAICYLYPR